MKRGWIVMVMMMVAGCATIQPQQTVQTKMTPAEVSAILMTAIKDIESKGCRPEFLSERGGFIWSRCKEGDKDVMKTYDMNRLVDQVIKRRKE